MSLAFSEMLPTPHLLISLFHIVFDDLFGTYSHHLRFVLLTFSAMSTNHHLLLIFPCHDKCVMVSLISYYYMSNTISILLPSASLRCLPFQTSEIFIPQCLWPAILHLLCVHTTQPCFPHHLCDVYRSIFSDIFVPYFSDIFIP